MSQGYIKQFVEDPDNWWSLDDGKEEKPQVLISTDWPLEFGKHFVDACIADPIDSLGTYCMGWEL